ncbi:hypothetical protein [Mesobacillus jeotgali]|uniref:hypothetical protein n=1 Tax=Mesobacillus jeotgali TaxID=129985 RepID=UPI0009A76DD6|nr:hypothetical protein [Mesobacillus jeotgali]
MNQLIEFAYKVADKMLKEIDKYEKTHSYHAYIVRLKILVIELLQQLYLASRSYDDVERLREHLSIIYRNADMVAEMNTMLKRTSEQNYDLDVKSLQETLTLLVPYVVQKYGKFTALYIVTPGFQQKSQVWS